MKIRTTWIGNGRTVKIPLCPSSFFNDDSLSLTVDWGDGSNSETITSFSGSNTRTNNNGDVVCNLLTHTYNNGRGHKVITITGGYNNKIAFMQTTSQDSNGNVQDDPAYGTRWLINRIFECNVGTQLYIHGQGDFKGFGKLHSIGSNVESLTSVDPALEIALSTSSTSTMFMDKTFFNCPRLQFFGNVFEPTNATSMQFTLCKCKKLDKCKSINNWDMQKVKSCKGALKEAAISIGLWKWFQDTPDKEYVCEDMSEMFEGSTFDKGVNGWDVSTVKDVSSMFKESTFNKPLWRWFKQDNVVENVSGMFQGNDNFNRDLETWSRPNVSGELNMFQGASGMSESKKPADVQVSATPTPSPSRTSAQVPTATPTSSLTPQATPSQSAAAPTATPTSSLTPQATPSQSAPAPTATPTSSLTPGPTPSASTSPPLGYFFDQIGKVYYNSSVADIISYNASTKALSLDTTGNGSSDTTVTATVDTNEKYSAYSSRDYLAIYKTTPSQVWKMKVSLVTYSSNDNRTYYDIHNSDYQDYTVGARIAQNADSVIATRNIGNYITNEMDSEYTTDPKDFYVLYGGSLQSSIEWGVAQTSYIRLYIDGNYTSISVGDYLEIYIA
jgi:hypothetical protein